MKRKGIILLSCVLVIFYGCKKPGCLGNAGPVTTVIRNLTSFNEVVLDSKINLILTQSSENRMEITAPRNIEPNITSIISGNTLTIMNEGNCGWMRNPDETVTVHLFFRDLRLIDY